jgi:N-acetylmuramoyl-L-alanine amidase
MRLLARALLLTLLVAAAARAAMPRDPVVSGLAVEEHGPIVELHFRFRGPRPAWHLAAQWQQLVLTLAATRLDLPGAPLVTVEQPPVTAVETAATSTGDARLKINVRGKVDYAVAVAPHDLVVRFARAGTAPDIAAPLIIPAERVGRVIRRTQRAPTPPAAPEPAPDGAVAALPREAPGQTPTITIASASLAPQARNAGPPLIVIDPGHGGRDPGTRSARGVTEKDLALQIAIRLQRALSKLGAIARLTRADDRFLSLAERTGVANRTDADLFISIHLNWSPEDSTSGIQTYYLNNTTDRATIRLAQMENGVVGGYRSSAIPNLNYILTDLRQSDKANESAALARMIEDDSTAAAEANLGTRVNNLGARQGPFYVLVGAEMPAVLVECGFLSNDEEAARLADGRYQQALADGIAAAVSHYLNGDAAVGDL